jgi:Uma2 family endonuclease
VLSPSTERIDRTKKLAIHAREAVQHVWLLDPRARALEILRLDGGRWSLAATHEGEQPIRAEPFDAITLELAALWA